MKRRDLLLSLGGSIAAPLVARAQQEPVPIIGLLDSRAEEEAPYLVDAFRNGLKESGFIEGQNTAIEYRFADNRYERLPGLAADLVQHRVKVIAALTTPAALVAKRATTTVPIVFEGALDPVQSGLVTNLNRPGGNITGTTQLNLEIGQKRLEVLHELLPKATTLALLFNPNNPLSQANLDNALSAARALGVELSVLNAPSVEDFEPAFAKIRQLQASGLVINSDPFFTARQEQLGELSFSHKVPAIYENRPFVAAGGLVSYGGAITEAYRQAGVYVGRILKGEKPSELPVQQVTKTEMILNLKTANAFGLTVPQVLLAQADEVIE